MSGLPVTRCLLTQNHRLATSTTAGCPQVAARHCLLMLDFLREGFQLTQLSSLPHPTSYQEVSWLTVTAICPGVAEPSSLRILSADSEKRGPSRFPQGPRRGMNWPSLINLARCIRQNHSSECLLQKTSPPCSRCCSRNVFEVTK